MVNEEAGKKADKKADRHKTEGPVRIGIDVGGTFTHAVALDGRELTLLGKTKVPTTHRAPEGVAKGIIDSLDMLLSDAGIDPSRVSFIAHSTTQATNALLEGDVAPVGILGMGKGFNAWIARMATDIQHLELAPGKFLKTCHQFIDTQVRPSDSAFKEAIARLVQSGAKTIAVSEAFSVDEPDNELRALEIALAMGLPATAGCQVSQLYGLKVRTRTAVINASMLPKMIESADMTEKSVRAAGIKAPIMIMRSDGGVMDIDAMRKRPIQTMLSGPAAGVAAAMMYLNISDGIFLEVGGTSTDISAIRNGRALVRSAEVGGHRVYMRTLDVRTVGVAGGSMPRLKDGEIIDVGPRSAHIAGLSYVSFSPPAGKPRIKSIKPAAGDPADYIAVAEGDAEPTLCLTPTCAANLIGLVPENDCARGDMEAIRWAFEALASATGMTPAEAAEAILEQASRKCLPVVSQLMKDYKLDGDMVTLVGGGGGAAAIVPYLSRTTGFRHTLAENADVVSAIGVALALLRETVERQIVQPSNDDILRIRQEAFAAVQKMGAEPSTIQIHVEIDTRTNTVRATATGAAKMEREGKKRATLSAEERRALVGRSLRAAPERVKLAVENEHFQVWSADTVARGPLGLLRTTNRSLRTLDADGVIRLQTKNGIARLAEVGRAEAAIAQIADEYAQYGDAGKVIPAIVLFAGPRMVDLGGLLDLSQLTAVAKTELESLPRDDKAIIIASLD